MGAGWRRDHRRRGRALAGRHLAARPSHRPHQPGAGALRHVHHGEHPLRQTFGHRSGGYYLGFTGFYLVLVGFLFLSFPGFTGFRCRPSQ